MADWQLDPPASASGWTLEPKSAPSSGSPFKGSTEGWTITPPSGDAPRGPVAPAGGATAADLNPTGTAASLRSTTAAPPTDTDTKGAFEQKAALEAKLKADGKDPRSDPAWVALTKKLASGVEATRNEAVQLGAGNPGAVGAGVGLGFRSLARKLAPGFTKAVEDDFMRIFNPAKRGAEAEQTAGMVRQGQAIREQEFQKNAENLRSFGREVGNLTPADRLDFMDAIETGKTAHLPQPLQNLSASIRKLFDDRWAKMDARGIAPNYIDDYLPHIWQDPAKAAAHYQAAGGGKSLEGAKAFKKERTFATIKDGIQAGLKPVTDNPIEMSLLQLHEMDRYITAQDIFNEMKANGLATQVPHGARAPAGWVPINDKIARGPSGIYYAPEQAATIVNRYLSPGLLEKYPNLLGSVRSVGNMMNSAQLGLSGFHALFVAADSATSAVAKGIKQISRSEPGEIVRGVGNILRAPSAPITNYLKGRKVLNQYLGRGQYGPAMEKIVDGLIAGGGRAKMDAFYRGSAAGSFWQSMRGSLMKSSGRQTLGQDLSEMFRTNNPVKAAAMLIPRVMDTVMAPLMEDFVPKMKMGVFYDLMSDELRINPTMSQQQLRQTAGRLWDSVDNRLGQLVYDNLFWNKMMRDVGHIGVRSLGWNLGTIRELGGGALDLGKGRAVPAGTMKQITDRASYVVAVPVMTAMMGAMYQYAKTGKGPQELKDYFFPKTGGKDAQGGDMRVSMPGYLKDAVEWSMQPGQTALGKVHPMWPTIYEMMNNQQWNGAAITDPRMPAMQNVKDYSRYLMNTMLPMSLKPQPGQKNSNISGIESFFGIRGAPYAIREPGRAESFERRVIKQKVKRKLKTDAQE